MQCSLESSQSYSTASSAFHPCIDYSLSGKYIVQVRFKETISGVVLPRTVANKYVVFVAHRIDNSFLQYDTSGSASSINAAIAFFSCYNPILMSVAESGSIDYVNNNMRAFGNIGEKGSVTYATNADSNFGGLGACLSAGASDVSLFT